MEPIISFFKCPTTAHLVGIVLVFILGIAWVAAEVEDDDLSGISDWSDEDDEEN